MAGLAVTYGLNLNARLSRWILSFCKLENKIISIERIHQYCHIPSEAPAVIDDSRPPTSWPENGKIELIDLKVIEIHYSFTLYCSYITWDKISSVLCESMYFKHYLAFCTEIQLKLFLQTQ